jgi:hypothetical protein
MTSPYRELNGVTLDTPELNSLEVVERTNFFKTSHFQQSLAFVFSPVAHSIAALNPNLRFRLSAYFLVALWTSASLTRLASTLIRMAGVSVVFSLDTAFYALIRQPCSRLELNGVTLDTPELNSLEVVERTTS